MTKSISCWAEDLLLGMERILMMTVLLFGVIILLAPCLGQESEQIHKDVFVEDPKLPIINTTGCSYSRYTYTDCKLKQVELQCNNSRRIQIVSSKYGKLKSEESSSNDARVASDIASQLQQSIQCSAGTLISCNASRTDSSYSSSQQYDLYKMCSWKSSCRPPSLGANFAHSISHRCVPEQPKVSLCNQTSIRGRLINIVFNGRSFREHIAIAQESPVAIKHCKCDIKSTTTYQLTAADIRLVDGDNRCLVHASISGINVKGDTTCSSDRMISKSKETVTTERTIGLSFDVPPEFVWIILRASTGETQQLQREPYVTVNCHPPINLKPPSTTTSTDKTSSYETKTTTTTTITTSTVKTETTTTTTTTGITDTTTNNHTHSTTLTTENPSPTPAGNEGYGQEMRGQRDTSEGGVPLPAIIVPIVVTFIAAIVFGIIMWRRRLLRQKKDDTGEKTKMTYQVPTTNGQISHYESAKPNRTDDNYLVLEQEHVYNTIASEHDKSVTINSKDAGQNNIYQTTEPRNNNASGINEENAYTPLNAATIDRVDNSVPNVTTTLQNMPPEQTNEYFTLEPQISSRTPMDAKDTSNINCPDHIDPNKGATLQDIPPTQSNEYFILEPQKTVLSGNPEGSPDTNKNSPDHKGKPETEASQSIPVTQTNEYFILEPHNTVSSGNPASVEDTNNEILGNGSTDDREAAQANDDGAGHDYFVLEAQSSPSPDDKLEGEMVDNSGLPENQHSEEKHDYFTLEPNELKEI